ncbi:MAG: zf-HC2 domain-containing protein [Thermoanaerobaculia bacterium]
MRARESVTCRQFRDAVTEYLEDAQSRGDRESFESHKDSCGSCQDFLNEIVDCIEGLGRLRVDDLTPEREAELVALLDGREPTEEERDRPVGTPAEELLRELMTHSPEQRVILIENSERFSSVELCRLALDRGYELGAHDPSEADSMIAMAVAIAEALDAENYPQGIVADLKARSYAHLGNVRRIRSDLVGSECAFRMAREHWVAGTRSRKLEAIICHLEAALLSEKRQFDAAITMLDGVIENSAIEGERRLQGSAWLSKAFTLGANGDFAEAIEAIERGIAFVNPEVDPRLVLVAKHNLLVFLREEGRLSELAALYPETRDIHTRLGNAVDLTRFKWLEGQIAVDTDRLSEAETLFLEVKRFFIDKGMAHDVALVSLDLALVYLRQDRVAELKALAAEMLTIFRSLRVHQETLAALAFCRKSLEVEKMTVGLVNELASCLEKARERARFGAGMSVAE